MSHMDFAVKANDTASQQADAAIQLIRVGKTFTQWQRDNTRRGILKNLIKPETRTITALDHVSFSIRKGEFVAYAGPNGSGKSTTMKLLSGMLLPNSGEISVLGLSPNNHRIPLMKRIGILFGNRTELWYDHPIIQSFAWKKVVWDIPESVYKRNLAMVIELLDLGGILKTFARELSLGQRMKADLAMMLLHEPEVILLDEPTLGLDVVAKRQMIAFLKRINIEKHVTIVVTSHDMDDLEEMAERILMIAKGKIVFDGSFNGLRKVTGSLSKVRVESFGGTITEWDIDLVKTPVSQLLAELSCQDNIRDIEICKAPIEQVIAGLYKTF